MITILVAAAMVQATSSEARSSYVSCLRDAVTSAQSAKLGVAGFKDYAHQTCASIEGGFKAKLVSFNVKNGMSKKAAADDAQVQLDDYVYTAEERYRYSVEPPK